MIGSPASTAAVPAPQNLAAAGNMPSGPARGGGSRSPMGSLVVWLILGGLYVLWAVLHNHQKVRDAIKPGNIAANLHNLLLVFLAVVVSMPLAKILLSKVSVWVPVLKPVTEPTLTLVEAS